MRKALFVALMLGLLTGIVLIIAGCSSSTSWLEAQAEYERAQAAKAQAISQGEVNIIAANTDAYTRRLEAELRYYQDKSRFDQDIAWQKFNDRLLQMEQFIAALKSAETLASDARTAADNSAWLLAVLPLGLSLVVLCLSGLGFYLYKGLEERLASIEGKLGGDGQTTA